MTAGVLMDGRLTELEAVIERGMTTFVEIGEALLEIRDERLYRRTHKNFEAYCQDRWGWSRRRADQLIQATEVAGLLGTTVPKPVNEAQARELVPLLEEPEGLIQAWQEVRERTNGKPTAAAVREVVQQGEELPIEPDFWPALQQVIRGLEEIAAKDAARFAAAVPTRRRAATAKRLRELGKYLGRIAWTLEGSEANQ